MKSDLLHRYISGTASEAEREQVTLWLMESPEHVKQYRSERRLFESILWKQEKNEIETSVASPSEKKQSQPMNRTFPFRSVFRELSKIAVIVVLTLVAVTWFTDKGPESLITYQELVVPAGQRAVLKLSDGTEVWLNSRSKLTFPSAFTKGNRNVKLEGEGYFNVSKHADHPFIVETNRGNIRVLGTEFNVLAYPSDSEWELALVKGSVEILSSKNQKAILKLEPNTKVTLKGDRYVKENIGETSRFLWREGLLCLTNITVGEMFRKMELYYGITIQVNNKDLLKNKYTGKFRILDGVEHVLKVLQLKHHFSYVKDDKKNMIIIN